MRNFTELDMYLFGQATNYDIFRKMGAHPAKDEDGKKGIFFDVWAPHAKAVAVIGDFNGWNETSHMMERLSPTDMGIWELFTPDAKEGSLYKYLIYTEDGRKLYKADPFATTSEVRPETASKVYDITGFKWTDSAWMKKRAAADPYYEQPMAIYEVHPGSWKRHPGREDEGFYTYREFADA